MVSALRTLFEWFVTFVQLSFLTFKGERTCNARPYNYNTRTCNI